MAAGLNRYAASRFVLETLANMTIGIKSIKQTAAQSLWRPGIPTDQPGEASEGIHPCPLAAKLPVRIAAERHRSAPSRPPPVSLRDVFAFPAHSCFVSFPLPQGEPSTHHPLVHQQTKTKTKTTTSHLTLKSSACSETSMTQLCNLELDQHPEARGSERRRYGGTGRSSLSAVVARVRCPSARPGKPHHHHAVLLTSDGSQQPRQRSHSMRHCCASLT
jgi:hypothetical protein